MYRVNATDGNTYYLSPISFDAEQRLDVADIIQAHDFVARLLHDSDYDELLTQTCRLRATRCNLKQCQHQLAELIAQQKLYVLTTYKLPRQPVYRQAGGGGGNDETVVVGGGGDEQTAGTTEKNSPATTGTGDVNGKASNTEANTQTEGCPISMVTGEELLPIEEFTLPGPVPFLWRRFYRTGHSRDIGLGHGWTHSGCETLILDEGHVYLHDDEGRSIRLIRPQPGQLSRQLTEGLELEHTPEDNFILRQSGQADKVFQRQGGNIFRLSQLRHKAYRPANDQHRESTGYAIDFHYNSDNRLMRIQGKRGRGLLLVRDEHNRISAIHQLDKLGNTLQPALCRYQYDNKGDLIAHQNADGHGEQYRYENHIIRQRTLATGFSYYFEWDQLNNNGRCLRNWGDKGIYDYTFSWDPANNSSSATDSLGHTRSYKYNQFALITEETDGEGSTTQYQYNSMGKRTAIIDPMGNKTQYHYDKQGRLLGITDALGQQSGGSYFQGEMTSFLDAEGNRWRRKFNRRGLLIETQSPQGASTRYEYTNSGLPYKSTDPAGRVYTNSWNKSGELIREHDPLGNTIHYAYDDFGRINAVTVQAAGQHEEHAKANNTTHYEYTAAGLLSKIINPAGDSSHYEYNAGGQLSKYTDAQGRITQYHYEDGLTQPSARIDAAGQRIQYHYDKERKLSAITNENGDNYRFDYDANERLIRETGFDGRSQRYQYNAAGHLIKHIDSGLIQTDFQRDALGQLLSKTSQFVSNQTVGWGIPSGAQERLLCTPTPSSLEATTAADTTDDNQRPTSSVNEQSHYRYDALGRLIETHNAHHYLQYQYDALGNILSETSFELNEKLQRIENSKQTSRHQYNILGLKVSTILPDDEHIQYSYHDSLDFKGIKLNGRIITALERDSFGKERQRQQGQLNTQTDYDPQGRLQQQRAIHQDNKHSPIHRQYGYDPFGNLNRIKDGPEETRYIYDTLNRLTRTEDPHGTEFFDFDPAGNLLSVSNQKKHPPGLAKGNRLLIQGDAKYQYDERGNLIRESRGKGGKIQKTYHYNLQNQLIKVQTGGKHQTVHYQYDPLGRRTKKTDAFGTSTFLWTDNTLAQESRNNIKKTYIHEPNSFRPAALVENGEIYHYHLDHLGTPRELTDQQGTIVWKARYRTYGALALKNATKDTPEPDQVHNNLRFQGQYFDEETGLHYNRFRYYNPNTGQFTTQDPIGLLGGLNNYQYAPNPVGWVDPLGLRCKENPWNEFQKHHQGLFSSRNEASKAYQELKTQQSPWPYGFDYKATRRTLQPGESFSMIVNTDKYDTPGRFGTFDDIPDIGYGRQQLAIKEEWKASLDTVVTYRVRKPIDVYEGPVGPQIDGKKYLKGGGTQINFADNSTWANARPSKYNNYTNDPYLEVVSVKKL